MAFPITDVPGSSQPVLSVRDKRLAKEANIPEYQVAEIRKAAQQFEGYFAGALLKQMSSAKMKGHWMGERSEMSTFREMFNEEVGKSIGKSGGLGLADMLVKSLVMRRRQVEPAVTPDVQTGPETRK